MGNGQWTMGSGFYKLYKINYGFAPKGLPKGSGQRRRLECESKINRFQLLKVKVKVSLDQGIVSFLGYQSSPVVSYNIRYN